MDIQETIDSLRRVLEGVVAPGVEELRSRLDRVEKEIVHVHGDVRHLESRMEDGAARADVRMDAMSSRMEDGFARADVRMDAMSSRMEDGFTRMDVRMDALNTRMDALMAAIMSTRTYPDLLVTRLDRLEREIQELRKA